MNKTPQRTRSVSSSSGNVAEYAKYMSTLNREVAEFDPNAYRVQWLCQLWERNKRTIYPYETIFFAYQRQQDKIKFMHIEIEEKTAALKANTQKPEDSVDQSGISSESSSKELTELKAKMQRLQTDLCESHRQNLVHLQRMIDYMEGEKKAYQELDEFKGKIDAIVLERDAIKASRDSMQKQLSQTEAGFANLRMEHHALKDKLLAMEEEMMVHRKEVRDLNGSLEKSKMTEEKLTSAVNRSAEIINNLNDEIETLKKKCANGSMPNSPAQQSAAATGVSALTASSLAELKNWSGKDLTGPPIKWSRIVDDAHADAVTCAAYNYTGNSVATGSSDRTVKIWNPLSGQSTKTLTGANRSVISVNYSMEDGIVMGSCADGPLLAWQVSSSKLLYSLNGHKGCSVAKFVNPNKVASGGHDRKVMIWDTQKLATIRSAGCGSKCNAICWSGSGMLAAAHYDKCIRLYDANSLNCHEKVDIHNASVTSVCLSPDHLQLLTNSRDNTLKLLDTRQLDVVSVFTHESYRNGSEFGTACFSHDGSYILAGGSDGRIYVWNTLTQKLEHCLKATGGCINAIAVSSSGHQMLACHQDKKITMWER